MAVRVSAVPPVGTKRTMAFVEHQDESLSGLHEVELPVYPDSPMGRELRGARLRAGIGLRHCAELLGLSLVEMSGLERGSYTVDDWDDVLARVQARREG